MTTSARPADLWMHIDEPHGTLHFGGTFDRRGCAHVGEAVLDCLCRAPAIHVLDLREVEVLSAAAIHLIDRVRHLLAASGRSLQIVCRVGTPVQAALAVVGLDAQIVGGPAAAPA